jgi:hypothetical protein
MVDTIAQLAKNSRCFMGNIPLNYVKTYLDRRSAMGDLYRVRRSWFCEVPTACFNSRGRRPFRAVEYAADEQVLRMPIVADTR